jgi:hypothetical protein
MAPVDASAAPTGAGAVQQEALIPLVTSGVGYSDIAGTNSAMGVGSTDLTEILAMCTADAAVLTNTDNGVVGGSSGPVMAAPASGKYRAFLIYAYPVASDLTDADDPNLQSGNTEATIPYYNPSNPGTPLAGPGGNGIPQASLRAKVATFAVRQCSSDQTTIGAAVGLLTTPTGCVPMYVVVASSSSTTLSTCTRFAPGRGLGLSTYVMGDGSAAPWISGILQQHHQGVPGQAPKIDGGSEWAPQSAVYNDTGGGGGTPKDFFNLRDLYVQRALRASKLNVPSNASNPTTPSIAVGSSPASNASLDANASDTAGKVSVIFATGSFATGVTVLATVTTASGLAPEAVALTPCGSSQASGFSAANLTFGWQATGSGWELCAYNQSGSTIAIGSITIQWSYVAIF